MNSKFFVKTTSEVAAVSASTAGTSSNNLTTATTSMSAGTASSSSSSSSSSAKSLSKSQSKDSLRSCNLDAPVLNKLSNHHPHLHASESSNALIDFGDGASNGSRGSSTIEALLKSNTKLINSLPATGVDSKEGKTLLLVQNVSSNYFGVMIVKQQHQFYSIDTIIPIDQNFSMDIIQLENELISYKVQIKLIYQCGTIDGGAAVNELCSAMNHQKISIDRSAFYAVSTTTATSQASSHLFEVAEDEHFQAFKYQIESALQTYNALYQEAQVFSFVKGANTDHFMLNNLNWLYQYQFDHEHLILPDGVVMLFKRLASRMGTLPESIVREALTENGAHMRSLFDFVTDFNLRGFIEHLHNMEFNGAAAVNGLRPPGATASRRFKSDTNLTLSGPHSGDSGELSEQSSAEPSITYNAINNWFANDEELRGLINLNDNVEATRDCAIRSMIEDRVGEFTRVHDYTIFVGTWNVNGRFNADAAMFQSNFLGRDEEAPDFYALGFQEMDLSKEAYLYLNEDKKNQWISLCKRSLHAGKKYRRLKDVQLIGMMLVVFVSEHLVTKIRNVDAQTVGTGLLGKMGNKGGVAIRFDIHDTSLCFVNCHLAAHLEQWDRRNQDYVEINNRMLFTGCRPPRRIVEHDQVYWFGDMNYRLRDISSDSIKFSIDVGNLETLLARDQLLNGRSKGACFVGYEEGPITFVPTYKYDINTNDFDSSEKRRPPAWCDRVLWRRSPDIHLERYNSHQELKASDHKPVSALFTSKFNIVDKKMRRKVYEDINKQLDKLENDYLPQVSIDRTDINFGSVSFKESKMERLKLTNVGQSIVFFRFKNKLNDQRFCKSWLFVCPEHGMIKKNESVELQLSLNFDDPLVASRLNYQVETLADTLVLNLIGGKDIFVTISGDYRPSCFGLSLEALVRADQPIGTLTTQMIKDKFYPNYYNFETKATAPATSLLLDTEPETAKAFSIPKELFAIVDCLLRTGLSSSELFQDWASDNDFLAVRDALDQGRLSSIDKGNVAALTEALLLFLQCLPEPVVPNDFYARAVHCVADNPGNLRSFFKELPDTHREVFQYVILLLREVYQLSNLNNLDEKMIAKIFVPVLFRNRPRIEESDFGILQNFLCKFLTLNLV